MHRPASSMEVDAQSLVLLILRSITCPALCQSGLPAVPLTTTARAVFLLRILLSGSGISITERDLYYTDPSLFSPQGQRGVHSSLARLCTLMELGGLVAAATTGESSVAHGGSSLPYLSFLLTDPRRALREAEAVLSHGTEGDKGSGARAPETRRYTRDLLGVTAAPRSVLVGPLSFRWGGRNVSVAQRGADGLLVSGEIARQADTFSWDFDNGDGSGATALGPVLVSVEKECTLRHLLTGLSQQPAHVRSRCIFLCTKGYPCVASRELLRRLHGLWPTLPMVGLVDGDPHGLQILLTLITPLPEQAQRCGRRRCGADATLAQLLPLRWLGIKPSMVAQRGTSRSRSSCASPMALTPRDSAVLESLRARLAGLTEAATSCPSSSSVATETVTELLREVEWMATAKLKCQLQAGDPLGILLSACETVAARC